MPDNEKGDEGRVQLKLTLDLKNPERWGPYRRAMAEGHQRRPNDLLSIIVDDWLLAFESKGVIRPFGSLDPPPPKPKPKSGSHVSFKPGAAVKGQGRSS